MYLDGIGTDRSPEEAFRLISLSASAGWSEAQKNLGNMYRAGNGVEQSLEEAVRWYRKGVPHGDFIMGLYESGIDIEDSDDGSVRLIDRFSEENDPEAYAMYILGRLYEAGLGVERSQDKADRWLRLARERSGDQGRRYQTVSQRPCFRTAEREKACSDTPMLSIINR